MSKVKTEVNNSNHKVKKPLELRDEKPKINSHRETSDKAYRDLRKYVDGLPVGSPTTKSDAEIRLLKQLFTPDEARLVMHLSMVPEPISSIYQRLKKSGESIDKLQHTIDRMVNKGTIIRTNFAGEDYYRTSLLTAGVNQSDIDQIYCNYIEDAGLL